MIRHTGGLEFGATSTRSMPTLPASARASAMGNTPSCLPSKSMTRTFGTLIPWLIRRFLSIVHLLLDGDIHPLKGCSVSLFVAAALLPDEIDKGVDRHGTEVLAVSLPRGNRPGSNLLVPDDEHVGDLLELRLADLVTQFLVLEILLHAQADIEKLPVDLLAVGDLAVRDGDEDRLDRGEPHRKGPGVVLD